MHRWILALALATNAQATNYYVSTSGNNANTGLSAGAAWQTVSYAASRPLLPGDNIYIEPGTYNGENVLLSASGSAGNPISFRQDPANPGLVTITPNAAAGVAAFQQNAPNLSYVTIMGLVISGVKQAAALDFGNGAAGASNIQILNNTIQNVAGGNSFAIRFYTFSGCGCSVSNVLISGNTIQNIVSDASGNPNQIIAMGGSISNSQVLGNAMTNLDSQAIDILGGYSWLNGSPSNILVQQNVISNDRSPSSGGWGAAIFMDGVSNSTVNANSVSGTQGWGIEVSDSGDVATAAANNNLISNNLVSGSLRAGINVGGWNAGYPLQRADSNRIYNNSLYNNDSAGTSGEIMLERGNSNDFQNNIVYAGAANIMLAFANSVGSGNTGNTFDYNDWYSASVGTATWQWFAGSVAGLANWKAASAQDASAINADPQFVNAAAANFALACSSPARDSGKTLALVPKDYNNSYARPIGGIYDRGAYEISCATPTPTASPSATPSPTPTPAMALVKTVNVAQATIGDTITYCLAWSNGSNSTVPYRIWDSVPSVISYQGCSLGCAVSAGVVSWNFSANAGTSGSLCFWGTVSGYP